MRLRLVKNGTKLQIFAVREVYREDTKEVYLGDSVETDPKKALEQFQKFFKDGKNISAKYEEHLY